MLPPKKPIEKPLILKETGTSPVPSNKGTQEEKILNTIATIETPKRSVDRYNRTYTEEEDEEKVLDREDKEEKDVSKVETEGPLNTTENSFFGSTLYFEKLVKQLKEEEEIKLSQINLVLQEKIQEVLKTNKELNQKIAELEKKIQYGTPVKHRSSATKPSPTAETRRESQSLSKTKQDLVDESATKRNGYSPQKPQPNTLSNEKKKINTQTTDSPAAETKRKIESKVDSDKKKSPRAKQEKITAPKINLRSGDLEDDVPSPVKTKSVTFESGITSKESRDSGVLVYSRDSKDDKPEGILRNKKDASSETEPQ